MLAMDESVVAAMTESMKNEGFKPGHELHVWLHDGKYILIDGHTRRHCAIKAELTSVPCIVHHFESFEEAKQFALREQTDRRNLSDQEIAKMYMALARMKDADGKKAKSDAEIAAELQVSPRQIAKIKEVERKASVETLEAFKDGKISLNMAYNETKKELSAQKEETAATEKKSETVSAEKKEEEPTRGILSFEGKEYFSVLKCKDDFVDYERYNNAKAEYDIKIVETEDNLAIYQNLRIEGDKSKENKQKIKECKKIYKATLKSKPNPIDYFDQRSYDAYIAEHPVLSIGEKGRNHLRTKMTMVFQNFNLFNNMDVLRNCTLAQERVLKRSKEEAKQRAFKELTSVNMQDRMNYRPRALSGGQKQRVAIARALCMDPDIILFDEPTSALDPEMAGEVLEVMKKLAAEGRTMIVVTHEMNFARKVANRVVFMEDGYIVESGPSEEFFAHPKEKRSQEFIQKLK